MEICVVRKKAASLKELAREIIDVPVVKTIQELLMVISTFEYDKQYRTRHLVALKEEEIKAQSNLGRISFERLFNENKDSLEKSVEIMVQDFQDGLFRVYINQKEYTKLTDEISMNFHDEVVFIRLVMLAGRLW